MRYYLSVTVPHNPPEDKGFAEFLKVAAETLGYETNGPERIPEGVNLSVYGSLTNLRGLRDFLKGDPRKLQMVLVEDAS